MTILSLPCQAPWETVRRVFSLYWHMMPRALERVNSSLRQCDYMPPTQVMRVTLLSLYIHTSFKWFRKELDKNLLLTAGRGKMFMISTSPGVCPTQLDLMFFPCRQFIFSISNLPVVLQWIQESAEQSLRLFGCAVFRLGILKKKLLSVFPLEWQLSNLWGGRRGSRTHIDTPAAT